jgi:predicted ArsR family transcriptional regulator
MPLDAEITAMLNRVREVFGDEILAGIYERAQNAAIRQAASPDAVAADAPTDGRVRMVSDAADDGFVRALRNELDRLLTHH